MGKREAVLGTGVRIAAGALRPRNDGFNFTKNIEIYSEDCQVYCEKKLKKFRADFRQG